MSTLIESERDNTRVSCTESRVYGPARHYNRFLDPAPEWPADYSPSPIATVSSANLDEVMKLTQMHRRRKHGAAKVRWGESPRSIKVGDVVAVETLIECLVTRHVGVFYDAYCVVTLGWSYLGFYSEWEMLDWLEDLSSDTQ